MSDIYRLLFENSPVPFAYHQIVKDNEGNPVDYTFIEVNLAFADMTGLSKEEIINKKGTEVHPGIKECGFDWIGTYGKVALTGESVCFEQYFEPLNRRYDVKAWGDGHGFFAALFCDITENFVDITERKEMEKAVKYQLEVERLISDISTYFVNLPAQKIDDGLNYALKLTGAFFDVDRSYVFQFSRDGIDMSNTHEWCKPGIEPQISNLQNIPVDTVPWWMEKLTRFETINVPCVEKMSPQAVGEKGILQDQSIQSVLVVPIVSVNKLLGFIGFDFVTKEMTWAEEQVSMLKVVAEIISNALSKQQAEQKTIEGHQSLLKILDSIDAYIYVADLKTHEIIFMNRYGKNLFGDVIGETCWQALQEGQLGPCDFCTNDKLLDDAGKPTGVYQWELKNTKTGRWYDCRDTAFPWIDDHMVRLEIATDITERKHVQETLEDEKNKLATVLEKMLDTTAIGIDISDEKGNITFWNKAAEQISGYTAEEVIGNAEIMEWVYPDPKYRAEIIQKRQDMLEKNGRIEGFETIVRRKDGQYRTILWYTSCLTDSGTFNGTISLAADITERKQAEEALKSTYKKLQDSKENYRFLAENTPDFIYSVDRESRYTAVNQSLCQALGFEPHDVVGKNHRELGFPEDVVRKWEELHHRVFSTGKTVETETTTLMPHSNNVRTYEVVLMPVFDEKGMISSIRGTSRDITERKIMEREIFKADKLNSIGILAGGIAHDFNNYLATLLGNISLAKYYKDDVEKVFERMENIEKATLRAKDLSNQLLSFSKGAAPDKKTVSINQIILENVKFSLSGSSVSCKFHFNDDLYMVEIDEGQFSQVLNNLVINAVQAMPEGGIIEVAAEYITIEAGNQQFYVPLPEGNYIKISIKDEGIGIPEKHLQKVFDPYFTTKQKGSGLGLATSYSIIKNHGGHLSVESEIGIGTTFSIYLPAVTQLDTDAAEEDKIYPGTGKILLMDDEEDVLKATGDMLSALGYDVSLARDGRETIEIYMNALKKGLPFHLVIMDFTIPGGMGGKDVLKELLKKAPDVKAVVASGYSNDPVMADYSKYGFKGVLRKPFSMKELSRVVYNTINSSC